MPTRDPIVVFDVETIPDADHHEGDSFPKPLFHQVVALSYLKADVVSDADGNPSFRIDLLKSGGEASSSEEYLITGFFRLIEKWKPRLVTFNGRRFDIPVLRYRALKYGVSAPWFAQGESRWENYGYRYDLEWHCDVMDALSDFGASKSAALHEICALLGIPAKLGIDGSQVQSYFEQGRLAEIRDYCECDVLATYLVFLRFARFRGELTDASYEESLAALQSYLGREISARPYLKPFLTPPQAPEGPAA
jgi:predicted PolB exonuclease-like 3'-5' exonuclease